MYRIYYCYCYFVLLCSFIECIRFCIHKSFFTQNEGLVSILGTSWKCELSTLVEFVVRRFLYAVISPLFNPNYSKDLPHTLIIRGRKYLHNRAQSEQYKQQHVDT